MTIAMALARIRHESKLLMVAVQYFTRLPTPVLSPFDPTWLSQSVRYFPLVGALVGGLAASGLWLSSFALPTALAAALAVALSAIITGGFHEDGLADTFDALGGTASRDRALEIMRDSRIGTYGGLALTLSLLVRWQVLCALPLPWAMMTLICGHAAARAGAATLMASLAYVRIDSDAKAKPVAQDLGGGNLVVTLLLGVAPTVAVAAVDPRAALPMIAGLAGVALVRVYCAGWFTRRLGGYTGDGLGCAEQLGEIAFGLAAVATVLHGG